MITKIEKEREEFVSKTGKELETILLTKEEMKELVEELRQYISQECKKITNEEIQPELEPIKHGGKVFGIEIVEAIKIPIEVFLKLVGSCQNAVGAYEALKTLGADKHLPGYERCMKNLNDILSLAEQYQRKIDIKKIM